MNQLTVSENKHIRRPDVALFVNGLPLALLELKNAADGNATIWTAFAQTQTYKAELETSELVGLAIPQSLLLLPGHLIQ